MQNRDAPHVENAVENKAPTVDNPHAPGDGAVHGTEMTLM